MNDHDPQRPDSTPGFDPTRGPQEPAAPSGNPQVPGAWDSDPSRHDWDSTQPFTHQPYGATSNPAEPATSPYPTHQMSAPPASEQRPPWEDAAPKAGRSKGRAGLAVAAVLGVLLIGAGAGAGGAMLWNAADDNPTTNPASSSSVVDNGKPVVAEGTVASVAAQVLPSVVKIEVTGTSGSGSGSGIVLSSDGEILTNHHVVEMAEQGGTLTVIFNNGDRAEAEIVGTDALTDSALIKAKGVSDLSPASLGKSSRLVVGQDVVAIGAPFGLNATVTSGIVSALERPVSVGTDTAGNATTYPAIQTDAAINPGNSGGPLVDMNGNVIGINSSIRTASDSSSESAGSIGLGFAIPIDELLPIVDQMRAGDTPTHARLGISVGSTQTGESVGALVAGVTDKSTAAKAGLKKGDVITKIDDNLIDGPDSLIATVRSYRPGDKVSVTWLRNDKEQSATLTLDSDEGKLAASTEQPQQEQQQPQEQQESPFGGQDSPFGPQDDNSQESPYGEFSPFGQ